MRTRRPSSIDFIVSLNVAYASAAFAQIVSPPNGGISTAYSMLIAGGRGRNAESVCHPEPKIIATCASASLTTGWTLTCPSTPFVYSVLGELAEAQAERLMIRMGDLLIPEEDHLVAEQRMLDLRELGISELSQVDTLDLAPHGRGEFLHDDVVVRPRPVVEPTSRMDDQVDLPSSALRCRCALIIAPRSSRPCGAGVELVYSSAVRRATRSGWSAASCR